MSDLRLADTAWKPLHGYLSCVQGAVGDWRDFLATKDIDWMPNSEIEAWLNRFDNTLLSLRDLLTYDEHTALDVRPENSGLPQHYHVQEISRLHRHLDSSVDYQTLLARLKRAQLDHIFESGTHSPSLLREIGQTSLRIRLQENEPLRLFHWCGIRNLESPNGNQAFLCSWERYTAQPLPVRYVMVFETSDGWNPNDENLDELMSWLKHETEGLPKLGDLGSDIDRAHAHIHPKWIGRLVLGPLFMSHLTQDVHQLQKALDSTAAPGEYLGASRIIYEYVLSDGEKTMTDLTDPEGRLHCKLQDFGVRLNGEHYERQVTHLEKHLFVPHGVAQLLNEEYRKEIGHQLYGV
jgi:hypothetical protein